ncbi:MAG: serine/threonine protein kinase [Gemmatales bacterium]|nr:MAG: serine/threonine protein kinase [Gemmatales bacterium]
MTRRTLTIAMPVILLVCSSLVVRGDNWPRFRGPNGTGVSHDKNIPVKWTEKNILWKTRLPGLGNSSPIVWENRVFVQSAPGDDSRALIAVDAIDGKIVWIQSVPGKKAHIHPRNSLASSTPATDGERVYCLFWDGENVDLHAFDFQTGKPLWKHSLGSFTSQHGAGHSPIVYNGKVIINKDQDRYTKGEENLPNFKGRTSQLVAVDARTGKEVWSVDRQAFRVSYSTPLLVKTGNRDELIVTTSLGVTGYDPDTGKQLWHWNWKFYRPVMRTVGSPIYSEGIVFVGSGDGSGARHFIAVKKGESGDVSKTNLVWEKTKPRSTPYVPTALARGPYIYYVNDIGVAGCWEAKTGKQIWEQRLGGGFSSSPVMIDGKIYAVNEAGQVYVFAAEPEFKLLAKNDIGEPCKASPAVANGRLYIRGRDHLFCIGQPAGQ